MVRARSVFKHRRVRFLPIGRKIGARDGARFGCALYFFFLLLVLVLA